MRRVKPIKSGPNSLNGIDGRAKPRPLGRGWVRGVQGGGALSDERVCNRLVGIAKDDLMRIPTRLGVAGGKAKARSILGALRGGYVNVLVTDSSTATLVLEIDQSGR